MRKPSSAKTARRTNVWLRTKAKHDVAIAATLKNIREIKSDRPQAANIKALLTSWLSDESGYDEKTWPKLKKALDHERKQIGARGLFDG